LERAFTQREKRIDIRKTLAQKSTLTTGNNIERP